MRPIAGTDILDFYASRYDLLVLTAASEFEHIDGDGTAYEYIETAESGQVRVLLERRTITDGDWFADALNDDGHLVQSVANEMAEVINADGIIDVAISQAQQASAAWEQANAQADQAAAARSHAVATVVKFTGGNQSAAGRLLGLDQSTVNKLVKKAKRAAVAGDRITVPAHYVPEDWPTTGEVIEVGAETTVVELDNGNRQELPSDDVSPV